ncbi:hypothetical protein Tco_0733945 [Tanacetum coccineum]
MNDIVSSDEEWEESNYRNPPNTTTDSFFKPYLEAQEVNDMEKEDGHDDEERFNDTTHERPVCNIRRFEMIKYSFGEDKEYVVVKEHEYDDLTSTNEDACRTYQEIFRRMDEGWVVTRA